MLLDSAILPNATLQRTCTEMIAPHFDLDGFEAMNPSLIVGLRPRDLPIIVVLRVIILAFVPVQLTRTKVTAPCFDLVGFDRNSESTPIEGFDRTLTCLSYC